MTWTKPEMVEIKMDAEISSYQAEDYDPLRDGPLFTTPHALDQDAHAINDTSQAR